MMNPIWIASNVGRILYANRHWLIPLVLAIGIAILVYMLGKKASKKVKIPWKPTSQSDEPARPNFEPQVLAQNVRELLGGWVRASEFVAAADMLFLLNRNELILVSNAYNKLYEGQKNPTLRSSIAEVWLGPTSTEARLKREVLYEQFNQVNL